MTLTRGALRALTAGFWAVLAVIWVVAWLAPAIASDYLSGEYLVAARALATGHGLITANLPAPIAQTAFPPLFPALLALWSLVSRSAVWLKALPVVCSIVWFVLVWKLLRKMGAGAGAAGIIVFLTAASPGVIALGANLFAESLFALLLTAALVLLLDGRPALAGLAAGLGTLASAAGIPLIVACMITLVARRRLRDAILFTAPAILLVAPWFGWALAHGAHDAGSGINTWSAANIFTALEPGDKLIVVLRNFRMLFASPFTVLSGADNVVAAGVSALLVIACLIRRRRLLPDLFLLFYAVMLLCRVGPPERFIAPVLPLVLWILWRGLGNLRRQEAVMAGVLLLAIVPLWQDFRHLNGHEIGRWTDMEKLFAAVRAHTAPDSVLAANSAPLVYLETGRKCIRGFDPAPFDLYYSPRPWVLPPDQFSLALMENGVNYVALTPGDALHPPVGALERGGVLEPVPMEELPRGYEILRVVR
jgi:hypothetical protein